MRRVIIALLLLITSGTLLFGESLTEDAVITAPDTTANATNATTTPTVPKSVKAHPPVRETPPEGTAWHAMGLDKFTSKTGIKAFFELDSGLSVNNTADGSLQGRGGGANAPVGIPIDNGYQMNAIWAFITRIPQANIIPTYLSLPTPMPKRVDWGFQAITLYGQDAMYGRMAGWDTHWAVNEPGATNTSAGIANRQTYLATPFMNAAVYLPIWKGVVITGGRWGDTMGYEIPPNASFSPNFFYSHTYVFQADSREALGIMASANVLHSRKHGYMLAEFALTNGLQTAVSPSGTPLQHFEGALRWNSPYMTSSVAYSLRVGDGNIKTNSYGAPVNNTDFSGLYMLYSPRGQRLQMHEVVATHVFNKYWNAEAAGTYMKQSGDGKLDTYFPFSGAGFRGANAAGINGRVIYRLNQRLAAGARLGTFNDSKGFFLCALNAYYVNGVPRLSKGYFNDFTTGLNFSPTKNILIRPEFRYDWNNKGAYGTKNVAVMNGTSSPLKSQTTFSMDTVFRF
jgi:hypothetical protein